MSVALGTYQHFKGGMYEVIGVAHHSEDLSEMVVYKSLYETAKFPKGTLWVRPKELFVDTIERNDTSVARFTKLESKKTNNFPL